MPRPDYCFVDLETGDTDPATSDIIEIGAVRVDSATLSVRYTYESKVRPVRPVKAEAAALNGYVDLDWSGAPGLDAALPGLFTALDGAVMVGAFPAFDWGFIVAGCASLGIEPPKRASRRMLDVCSMAAGLYDAEEIDGTSLNAICDYFGVRGQSHRALSDARRALDVFRVLRRVSAPLIEAARRERMLLAG
jgi:DNA polymerase III epsilon subunit-like protein